MHNFIFWGLHTQMLSKKQNQVGNLYGYLKNIYSLPWYIAWDCILNFAINKLTGVPKEHKFENICAL